MHLVESKFGNTIKFRPSLPIDYIRSPRLSRYPDLVKDAGIEDIKFVGNGTVPGLFVEIACGWNVWVKRLRIFEHAFKNGDGLFVGARGIAQELHA